MSHSTTKAPYKSLKQIAADRKVTVETMIADAVAANDNLRDAAKSIGVGLPSIQWWMARNGYRVQTTTTRQLVKVMQEVAEASQS